MIGCERCELEAANPSAFRCADHSPAYAARAAQLEVSDAALAELIRACERFGPMASPHEGWAVIREEVDELWEHVRGNTGRSPEARVEAIQVAAVAMRYALDLCPPSQPKEAPCG